MAVGRNAGKGAESTNAASIQGQKNGNNKSSGGQKEHKDSSHIWEKKPIFMISKTLRKYSVDWQDKKKKLNVLEALSHVTCDVNVRTNDDND